MLKNRIAIFIILTLMAATKPACCQNETDENKIHKLNGKVVATDWVGSTMVVKWTDPKTGNNDEMTFTVPGDAEITKGTGSIGFFDVNISDTVTVEYYNDNFAGLKATGIVVHM